MYVYVYAFIGSDFKYFRDGLVMSLATMQLIAVFYTFIHMTPFYIFTSLSTAVTCSSTRQNNAHTRCEFASSLEYIKTLFMTHKETEKKGKKTVSRSDITATRNSVRPFTVFCVCEWLRPWLPRTLGSQTWSLGVRCHTRKEMRENARENAKQGDIADLGGELFDSW